jgi:hypothetical protein
MASPRDVINPVHIDTIVPDSVSAMTAQEAPGIVIIKAQIQMPPPSNLQTLMLHLTHNDAHILYAALSKCLKGTSN